MFFYIRRYAARNVELQLGVIEYYGKEMQLNALITKVTRNSRYLIINQLLQALSLK